MVFDGAGQFAMAALGLHMHWPVPPGHDLTRTGVKAASESISENIIAELALTR